MIVQICSNTRRTATPVRIIINCTEHISPQKWTRQRADDVRTLMSKQNLNLSMKNDVIQTKLYTLYQLNTRKTIQYRINKVEKFKNRIDSLKAGNRVDSTAIFSLIIF